MDETVLISLVQRLDRQAKHSHGAEPDKELMRETAHRLILAFGLSEADLTPTPGAFGPVVVDPPIGHSL